MEIFQTTKGLFRFVLILALLGIWKLSEILLFMFECVANNIR
jgi:hypothetical protein